MAAPKGFMVLRNGPHGKKPKYVHKTLGEALTEAQRLAKKEAEGSKLGTGPTFLVVEIIGGCKMVTGEIQHLLPE